MTDAYARAGVNIDAANETVQRYRRILRTHEDPRVLEGIGSFSGSFSLQGFRDPVLVASTDGVGTKVLIASTLRRYDTIGADLVHHCINDILCSNAQPLFFLDYLAMGKLEPDAAEQVVAGISKACARFHVALLGGETAEMPGVYTPPHFDLAGTIVGALERSDMVDTSKVEVGDSIVGLPANGLHTNGYSLARKVLPVERWHQPLNAQGGLTIGDALLAIHPCYLPVVRAIQGAGVRIKTMAHITGGGLIDNLPRAFPENLAARLDVSRWQVPPIESTIVREAKLGSDEAYRTLNMGIGFCVIVDQSETREALASASASLKDDPIEGASQSAAVIGEIEPRHQCGPQVIVRGG